MRIRSIIPLLVPLLIFNWGAGWGNKSPYAKGEISMPSGWDDAIIDKIKSGKSTKKVLAVLDFAGNEKLTGKVDLKMSDMLLTSLVKTNRFELVERSKIDKLIDEQKLALMGLIDESTAAKVGLMLGAEYLVMGSITSATRKDVDKFGYMLVQIEVGVDVRVVNVNTAKILLSETAQGLSESKVVKTADGVVVSGAVDYNSAYADASRDAVFKVGAKIAKLSPLIGFVVSLDEENVTIDIGEEQGIKKEDVFVVFSVGEEILHPATKKHLGWKKETRLRIMITSTEKAMATATTIKNKKNKAISIGDYVISVPKK